MTDTNFQQMIESARRLGIEINEEEAQRWMNALAAQQESDEISLDLRNGVFGHRISMLDFSSEQLAYFRRVGRLVEFEDEPEIVETALALSGSSAQSKIQTYPGDVDFFERVNIHASNREAACQILARLMRQKALSTLQGPAHQLIEVKFGSFPFDGQRGGNGFRKGGAISWKPEEIEAGYFPISKLDGTETNLTWDEAGIDPGWCKLDWVVADPLRQGIANASNMLDVTWEAPDGSITPLDGYLDGYFQEVYLEASSVPLFSKLAQHVSANAIDDYVTQLEHEVSKYIKSDPANYGKAAKRMYNIFRLSGRYEEAAFLRELFDEPAALLYQVWSLIRTIDDCTNPDNPMDIEHTLVQADNLILQVTSVLEGAEEAEIVRLLLRLRDALTRQNTNQPLTVEAEAARAQVINIVNNFFYEKMINMPKIKDYLDGLAT